MFLRSTNEEACEITMRLYQGKILKQLHDIRHAKYIDLHHEHDYTKSQRFGTQLRQKTSWGIVYNSVRHAGGYCIATFRPPAVSIPKQLSHFRYIWNGEKIIEVLDTKSVLVL